LLNRSTADLVLGILKDDENELIQDFLNEITFEELQILFLLRKFLSWDSIYVLF
jgi:hypothetical protein